MSINSTSQSIVSYVKEAESEVCNQSHGQVYWQQSSSFLQRKISEKYEQVKHTIQSERNSNAGDKAAECECVKGKALKALHEYSMCVHFQ